MKASKRASKRRSARTFTAPTPGRGGRIRVGVESMDRFFSRMGGKARGLDHDERLEPGLTVSFEDPADFLAVITPARVRLLLEINRRAMAIFALATALSRDPSAVRRDVALLERKSPGRTRRVANPAHRTRTLVERTAASIELAVVL